MRPTRFCVRGFKGVDGCIGLDGALLIVGPPMSGKTSLLEALALFMQSKGEEWILIEGQHVIFHEPEDIHRNGDPSQPITFLLEFSGEPLGRVTYEYTFTTKDAWAEQRLVAGGETLFALVKRGPKGILVEPRDVAGVETCTSPHMVLNEDVLITCNDVESDSLRAAREALFRARTSLRDAFYFVNDRRHCTWKRSFETHVDLMPRTGVGSEGQYTLHQLSRVASDPRYVKYWEELGTVLDAVGIQRIGVSLVESGRIGGYIYVGGKASSIYHGGLFVRAVLPVIVQTVLANEGSIVAIDDLDLGLTEALAERLLAPILRIAEAKSLSLVATTRATWLADVAKRLGFTVVDIGDGD